MDSGQRSGEITVVRVFDAPREMLFRSFTQVEHLVKWWGPDGFQVVAARSDPRAGGELSLTMRGPDGEEFPLDARYSEVTVPERLAFEGTALDSDGRPALRTWTSISFVEEEGRTRVTVRARAEGLTPESKFMIGGMGAGWNQSLQRLDDHLTGAAGRQLTISRGFPASCDRVFEMWTREEHLRRWWGPEGFSITVDEIDVRPGGRWIFTMHGPDGVDYPNTVVYDEVSAPTRLVYTHLNPRFQTTVTFDEMMGMTALSMRLTFPTAEARDQAIEQYHADSGANQTLDRLGQLFPPISG